ncbi:MAG: TetR family transcriptional regulator C-terminal domain-containing protein [Clostridium sp.]|nr:TetR family transcriptional regulator C-terminal domain-containing protein [Clostridium sp.]
MKAATEEKNRTDRRVVRTKRAIRNAFAKLVSVKPLPEITVRELSDEADINRKTFYNYYSDIYQVMDEVENEIVTAFTEALRSVDLAEALKNPNLIVSRMMNIINDDSDFYGHVFSLGVNATLLEKLIRVMKDMIREEVNRTLMVDPELLDFALDFEISGIISAYQAWFNSGCRMDRQKLAKYASAIMFFGVNGLVSPDSDLRKEASPENAPAGIS